MFFLFGISTSLGPCNWGVKNIWVMGLVNMGVSENGAHPFSLWETYDPVVHSMGGWLLGLPLSKKTKNINILFIWWYHMISSNLRCYNPVTHYLLLGLLNYLAKVCPEVGLWQPFPSHGCGPARVGFWAHTVWTSEWPAQWGWCELISG